MESELLSAKPDYSNVSWPRDGKVVQKRFGTQSETCILMGSEEDMVDIVTAATKIRRYVGELNS